MSEHAIREYLKTIGSGGGGVSEETDPVFTASPAHGISAQDIADWNDKQDELVSGTNIKTINGTSILGSGDLPVAPPVTSTDVPTADTISEFDSDAHMNSTDMTTGSGSELEDFIDGLNVSGGGKQTVTATKVGSYYSSGTITAYKIGAIVTVKLDALALSALSSRTTVASLPAGFRPPSQVFSFLSGYTRGVFVNDDGKVQIESGSAGTYWSSITYVAWN